MRSAAYREELTRIRILGFFMSWGEVLGITPYFDRQYGVRLRVEGNNTFAVGNASRELVQKSLPRTTCCGASFPQLASRFDVQLGRNRRTCAGDLDRWNDR